MNKTTTHKSRALTHNGTHPRVSAGELKGIIEQSKLALSNAGGRVSEELHLLRDRLRDNLTGFQVRVKKVAKAARQQASRADDSIRSHPYQAIGIAAGVGLIAGLLIARRRSRV